MIPLLLLSLTFSTASHEQLTDATPNLIFFTVNDCSDCDIAKRAWDQLIQIEPPGIKLVEVCLNFVFKSVNLLLSVISSLTFKSGKSADCS